MSDVIARRQVAKARQRRLTGVLVSVIRGLVVVSICFIILRPVLVKLVSSFMLERDLYDQTVKWIPRTFTLENYRNMFIHMRYAEAFPRTVCFTVGIAFLQLASCTLVGYGFARFRFPGSNILFALVIFTLIVPPQIIVLPLYLNFRFFRLFGLIPEPGIDLLGGYWPFVLMAISGTGFNNGLFIFIMRQFFKGMPRALEEAAYIDGATPLQTFLKVMLPGARPALVVVFLFATVWIYNDYFFTLMFMRSGSLLAHYLDVAAHNYAHSIGAFFTGQYISLLNNTGMILFILPLLVLYIVMQRYFIESVERTGLIG
ncbi:MAG: carbohydrate ABC transporter permease [Bacillota bacterium]|jgi:multiple sugar transport system permease protein|nr:carbohydrate ABC transporter permease [Bacillota bacterium]HPZ54357.1 carbohydrate ABC transporter permease [Bacillota bacterium]HQD17641.1 carbohydrate ABC transporter permease [Bacillota bacterium]